MELEHVHFEAFKSLYSVDCNLDRFTVITGPNGAGKSNFVDALAFIGDTYAHGLEIAVSRAGGYENIAHRQTRRAKRPVRVSFEARLSSADLERAKMDGFWEPPRGFQLDESELITYSHDFSFRASSQRLKADFRVVSDKIELRRHGRLIFSQTRLGDKPVTDVDDDEAGADDFIRSLVRPFGDERFEDFLWSEPLRPTSLLTEGATWPNLLWWIRRELDQIRVYQLSPHQSRQSGVPTPNAVLARRGDNLPAAADHLMKNDPEAWSRVESAMRLMNPGLTSIAIGHTEDRRLALRFRETGVGRPWTSNEVSDGTIQSLAMYIALFDSRSPFVVFEEPENAVHPWILRHFVDLCRESSKQLLVTSHSPVLLNYVKPDSVHLAYMDSHHTHVRPLLDFDRDYMSRVIEGDLTVFDVYDAGAITEALPSGYRPESGD